MGSGMVILDETGSDPDRNQRVCSEGLHKKSSLIAINTRLEQYDIGDGGGYDFHFVTNGHGFSF